MISTSSGLKDHYSLIYGVPENFLDAAMTQYYFPNEMNSEYTNAIKNTGSKPKLINGEPDPIEAIFSDYGMPEPLKNHDGKGIMVCSDKKDKKSYGEKEPEVIRMIIPEGYRNPLAMDTNNLARL